MLRYQRALCAYVLMSQRILWAYMPTCLACLRANVKRASFDATFSFATTVAEVVPTVGKV